VPKNFSLSAIPSLVKAVVSAPVKPTIIEIAK
jgi:hypothetical protein